jgi:nucleoside-diphosphate-sugar epimerase
MSESILVTGAEGFIGKALCEFLGDENENNLTRISRNKVTGSTGICEDFNLHDSKQTLEIVDRYRPGTIFHLAGESSLTSSWSDPVNYVNYNTSLTKSLLSAVEKIDPSIRVVFFSSSAVYVEKSTPISERDQVGPDSPYGMSKLLSELELSTLKNYLILRPFSIVGSGKKMDALDDWITQILAFKENARNILRVGDTDVTRDFLSVQDAVRMTWELTSSFSGTGIFNLAAGIPTSLDRVVAELLEISGFDCLVEKNSAGKLRKVDKKYVVADTRKILECKIGESENNLRNILTKIYMERKVMS